MIKSNLINIFGEKSIKIIQFIYFHSYRPFSLRIILSIYRLRSSLQQTTENSTLRNAEGSNLINYQKGTEQKQNWNSE